MRAGMGVSETGWRICQFSAWIYICDVGYKLSMIPDIPTGMLTLDLVLAVRSTPDGFLTCHNPHAQSSTFRGVAMACPGIIVIDKGILHTGRPIPSNSGQLMGVHSARSHG